MKTKAQGIKTAAEETEARKGTLIRENQAVKKPAKAAHLSAKKTTIAKKGVAKKPIAGGQSNAPATPKTERSGIKKEHMKARKICKVTFRLPGEAAFTAGTVTVVGDFNHWDREATPMEKREDGDFTATVEVAAGKEYRFRYLIDGQRWENDWHADKYVKGPYGAEDSVVCA